MWNVFISSYSPACRSRCATLIDFSLFCRLSGRRKQALSIIHQQRKEEWRCIAISCALDAITNSPAGGAESFAYNFVFCCSVCTHGDMWIFALLPRFSVNKNKIDLWCVPELYVYARRENICLNINSVCFLSHTLIVFSLSRDAHHDRWTEKSFLVFASYIIEASYPLEPIFHGITFFLFFFLDAKSNFRRPLWCLGWCLSSNLFLFPRLPQN